MFERVDASRNAQRRRGQHDDTGAAAGLETAFSRRLVMRGSAVTIMRCRCRDRVRHSVRFFRHGWHGSASADQFGTGSHRLHRCARHHAGRRESLKRERQKQEPYDERFEQCFHKHMLSRPLTANASVFHRMADQYLDGKSRMTNRTRHAPPCAYEGIFPSIGDTPRAHITLT
jgi:hypothetical protein